MAHDWHCRRPPGAFVPLLPALVRPPPGRWLPWPLRRWRVGALANESSPDTRQCRLRPTEQTKSARNPNSSQIYLVIFYVTCLQLAQWPEMPLGDFHRCPPVSCASRLLPAFQAFSSCLIYRPLSIWPSVASAVT